ncbi:type II toxin-antitoxin system Phd/YefM family antitoxin [Streptomyces rubiginosohelvolus]|uniref:Type II toxin-antitoxin system Phd/YefM family antitoxin n=1 Tax=Streptomyces rubiginosohelvolus TaxID=67362 RepID=A0ABW6F619_9ACTN
MTNRMVGIEEARKTLGDLANEVRYTGNTITLTRNGKPIAQLTPMEAVMAVGIRVAVPEYAVPEDWARTGEITELNGETVVVLLDDGHRQELPVDEATAITETEES